jgi:hypothetical protein
MDIDEMMSEKNSGGYQVKTKTLMPGTGKKYYNTTLKLLSTRLSSADKGL